MSQNTLPIGVFDSGVGGLTVLKALQESLANESFIYLGDTARLPYGTKSPETVIRYATKAADLLCEQGIKMLVVACNTASAFALGALQQHLKPLPVIGVVEPGAKAICKQSPSGHIAVIATESTVRHGAYEAAIRAIRPDATVVSQSCSMFVALAEEGWLEGPIPEAIAAKYLESLFAKDTTQRPDSLMLGCTHFPALNNTIRNVVGDSIHIVDSAHAVAEATAEILDQTRLATQESSPTTRLLTTDSPARFAKVSGSVLGIAIDESDVQLV